jgi:hypothetical protein
VSANRILAIPDEPLSSGTTPAAKTASDGITETPCADALRRLESVYVIPSLSDGQIRAMELVRAKHLTVSCRESRELSLAQTHLEEALSWASKAIARHAE